MKQLFRCPQCGQGSLFAGILDIAPQCSHCQLNFRGHDVGDGAVFFVLSLLCLVVVVGALAVEFVFLPSVWFHIVAWPVVTVAGTILFLRPAKAWLLHKKYQHHGLAADDAVS